jgi:hypothetical protein
MRSSWLSSTQFHSYTPCMIDTSAWITKLSSLPVSCCPAHYSSKPTAAPFVAALIPCRYQNQPTCYCQAHGNTTLWLHTHSLLPVSGSHRTQPHTPMQQRHLLQSQPLQVPAWALAPWASQTALCWMRRLSPARGLSGLQPPRSCGPAGCLRAPCTARSTPQAAAAIAGKQGRGKHGREAGSTAKSRAKLTPAFEDTCWD